MAQLQNTSVTGSLESTTDIRVGTYLTLGNTENTSSVGNLWYDENDNSLKLSFGQFQAGSWSTGGALITGRSELAGAGTQNAGLAFGGSPSLSCTEEYNGTSWSSGGALSTARYW